MSYTLSDEQAREIDRLMPGNQLYQVGSIMKYIIDQVNDITDSGTNSVKFDNSTTPLYGDDEALVSIGTKNLPINAVMTDTFIPFQVNLSNTGNVAKDIAAARLKVATAGAQASVNCNVLELRHTIAHNVAQWATLQCSAAPAAHTIGVGEGLVGYFAMDGTGTITPAGSNAVAVMEVINNHTGAGVSDVAIFRNNATGYGATNIIKAENIIGTVTSLIKALVTAGTVTNGIEISGLMSRGINFSGLLSGSNTDGSILSTGSTWIDHATAGQCGIKLLLSYSATTGDFASLRIRAKSLGAVAGGAVNGTIGGNFSASAGIAEYSNLYAVQGYAQPSSVAEGIVRANTNTSNIICGVYSCVDNISANAGRSWSLWTDTHETVKATNGHYLHRLSHNGGSINLDGIWSIYAGQGCDYLMNFENTNAPVESGDKTGGGKSYSLAVKINGVIRHIQCYD
jgi:hypothetical protein